MSCQLCNCTREDLGHAFLLCPSICNWWSVYLSILNPSEHINKSFFVVLEHLFNKGNSEKCAKFCAIAQSIGGRRNKLIYEKLHIHPCVAIEKDLSLLAAAYHDYGSLNNIRTGVAWTTPSRRVLKVECRQDYFF